MFQDVEIKIKDLVLKGHLSHEPTSRAWIIFAHGSGSSRLSRRNNWVAQELNRLGFSTLLFDLLTYEEDQFYENRFNISLLAERLVAATHWLMKTNYYNDVPIAYYGASTGAAAALVAAAQNDVYCPLYAVISRGGRPDLAGIENLRNVRVPVLLIVGSLDEEVRKLNDQALSEIQVGEMSIVEGASHLFEEPGALKAVVKLSQSWLMSHLPIQPGEKVWDT